MKVYLVLKLWWKPAGVLCINAVLPMASLRDLKKERGRSRFMG